MDLPSLALLALFSDTAEQAPHACANVYLLRKHLAPHACQLVGRKVWQQDLCGQSPAPLSLSPSLSFRRELRTEDGGLIALIQSLHRLTVDSFYLSFGLPLSLSPGLSFFVFVPTSVHVWVCLLPVLFLCSIC